MINHANTSLHFRVIVKCFKYGTLIKLKRNLYMKMSSENEASNSNLGRVVTDSVHSRFRSSQVYCDICDIHIPANPTAIAKHFNNSHPSKENCCYYCRGKVFTYMQTSTDDASEIPTQIFYHKCSKS